MSKKIIIFGATGLVGAYTALQLKQIGYDVIAVGKRRNDNGFFKENDIHYVSLDIDDPKSFSLLPPKDIFGILHFAGIMPAHMEGYNPYSYLETNIIGTMNILEYSRSANVKKIIFSQSVSDVLYMSGTTKPIPADVEMRNPLVGDHAIYSISKNTAVSLIRHYEATYGIISFILRLPTIYAYHPNPFFYVDGVKRILGYRYLIKQAEKGNQIELWGNPKSRKEMVYIEDFIQLCECCLKSEYGGLYNVGNGFSMTFEEQIKMMVEVFSPQEKKSEIVYCPHKKSSPQFVLDISESKSRLGYNPVFDCRKTFEAFKKEEEIQRFKKLWGVESDYINW